MARHIFSLVGCMVITWLVCGSTSAFGDQVQTSTGWSYAQTHAYDETVARALRLLPKRPKQIVVIDAQKTPPSLRQRLERVEAFVVVGRPVVCLRMQGPALKRAHRAGGIFDYALAAIIWHEMAHISGADERGAQEQEEDLWRQFIVGRQVDTSRALQYLVLLKARRDAGGSDDREAPPSMESTR